MDLTQAIDYIPDAYFLDLLCELNTGPVAPEYGKKMRCLNPGAHNNGDAHPSMYVYERDGETGPHVHCHACGYHRDFWSLLGDVEGVTEPGGVIPAGNTLPRLVEVAAEKYGVGYEPDMAYQGAASRQRTATQPAQVAQPATGQAPVDPRREAQERAAQAEREAREREERAYRLELIKEAQAHRDNPVYLSYLQRRGISQDTAIAMGMGYLESYPVDDEGKFKHRAVIIPNGDSIIARNPDAQPGAKKGKVWKKGPATSYNVGAIYEAETVHIVEGEIDALTVIEAGGHAISVPSASDAAKTSPELIDALSAMNEDRPILARNFIVSMDDDNAGYTATEDLMAALTAIEPTEPNGNTFQAAFEDAIGEKPYVVEINIAAPEHDANDLWRKDPQALRRALRKLSPDKDRTDYESKYNTVAKAIDLFNEIERRESVPPIPTGFKALDYILDGGLYPGLYAIAGGTGMGKTAFALQLMENIATAGHDVLYASMEMGTSELIARGVSRHTFQMQIERDSHGDPNAFKCAKSIRGITNHLLWDGYSTYEIDAIREAFQRYATQSAEHIYIREGIGTITAESIEEWVKHHRRKTGAAPVVIVDYIQIIAPTDPRATDRQAIDHAVWKMKAMSRDFRCPVIVLSSINRQSYDKDLKSDCYKESGALEYTSDVALGIQLDGMNNGEDEDSKGVKSQTWMNAHLNPIDPRTGKPSGKRDMEIKVLKNRNGAPTKRIKYQYVPRFHLFTEMLVQPELKHWNGN